MPIDSNRAFPGFFLKKHIKTGFPSRSGIKVKKISTPYQFSLEY
jgi:hypothetical protein